MLMYMFHVIEKYIRTVVSNYLTVKYKDPELLSGRCYENRSKYKAKTLISDVHKNNYELLYKGIGGEIIEHHFQKYNGHFPFWVTVEGMSLGELYAFINCLDGSDKTNIASIYFNMEFKQLKSFIKSLKCVRNICAHFNTLAGKINPERLSDFKELNILSSNQNTSHIYSLIKICRRLLISIDKYEWNKIYSKIENLSNELHGAKYLESLNFKPNWIEELIKV